MINMCLNAIALIFFNADFTALNGWQSELTIVTSVFIVLSFLYGFFKFIYSVLNLKNWFKWW